mmetsp:Transcript_42377/g.116884  ORF Transcript_42377/g.116884 Transcript_42377/m.116884 type:complete len:229 (+) Transcript_42377:1875-2561(+)
MLAVVPRVQQKLVEDLLPRGFWRHASRRSQAHFSFVQKCHSIAARQKVGNLLLALLLHLVDALAECQLELAVGVSPVPVQLRKARSEVQLFVGELAQPQLHVAFHGVALSTVGDVQRWSCHTRAYLRLESALLDLTFFPHLLLMCAQSLQVRPFSQHVLPALEESSAFSGRVGAPPMARLAPRRRPARSLPHFFHPLLVIDPFLHPLLSLPSVGVQCHVSVPIAPPGR